MTFAPIAFFAYKRPDHALRALTSLSQCALAEQSALHIFCDGPKCAEDADGVRRVREAVKSKRWCGEVTVVERDANRGLAKSIIGEVSRLCAQHGKVIVVEDDLVLSPQFLKYMNAGLERYENEERVMNISGYLFPISINPSTDAFFLSPFAAPWGWATWHRAWQHYDPDVREYYAKLKQSRKLRRAFDDGGYPFFDMLDMQMKGELDTWDIQWRTIAFFRKGLTLFPRQTLVQNTGFDGSGTHCSDRPVEASAMASADIKVFPSEVAPDEAITAQVTAYRNRIRPSYCRQYAGRVLRSLGFKRGVVRRTLNFIRGRRG
jgi:hypothetical protein